MYAEFVEKCRAGLRRQVANMLKIGWRHGSRYQRVELRRTIRRYRELRQEARELDRQYFASCAK